MSSANDRQTFHYQGVETVEGISDILSQVVSGLQNGALHLSAGGDKLDLQPGEPVQIEMEARHNRGSQSLKIIVKWDMPLPNVEKIALVIGPSKSADPDAGD